MADAVAVKTLIEDTRHVGVLLTCVSDGTGESAVIKITFANLQKIDTGGGVYAAPVALDLETIQWTLTTFTSVDLFWKANTPDKILRIAGAYGTLDLTGYTVLQESIRSSGARDPLSTGHTGDITLTSNGPGAGATYNIVAYFRKRLV